MLSRQKLIAATQALLQDRGYVGTSPGAIQRRSGVGQGSMYYHFAGKADLALAAIEQSGSALLTRADQDLSGPGTCLERLERFLHRERNILAGCPIGRLAQDPEIVATPALAQAVALPLEGLRQRVEAVLREGMGRGEIDDHLDPAATAATVVAVLQGGYVTARAAADPGVFQASADGLLGLLRISAGLPA